ncbi:hypothetical protein GF354_03670 [Candidatus Peregrinibacteria bacterium]|nr:hypothetical protein [Candidatus Peregrinibacteria bacterium]
MIDLYQIKSQKLRSLIESSKRFALLSEENKSKILKKILSVPSSEREAKFIPFFNKKNKEEAAKLSMKEEKYRMLIDKLNEMDRMIKKMAFKDKEVVYKKEEKKEEKNLLEQIKNL